MPASEPTPLGEDAASEPLAKSDARWFKEEVQPHDSILRAWLRNQFPTLSDVDDVIQESYLRLLKEARRNGRPGSPKAFLFRTARNLVLDHLRHQRVERVNPLAEVDGLTMQGEGSDVFEAAARGQEKELLIAAIQSLPKRCRQIITLRKIYGISQKEVAAELGISEHTVEAQATIGLAKISAFFGRFERTSTSRRE